MKHVSVPIKNLPMSTVTREEADGSWTLISDAVEIFDGSLNLRPDPDPKTQKFVRSRSPIAMHRISAELVIRQKCLEILSRQCGRHIEHWEVVIAVCDLMSFASRRGVSPVTNITWWPHEGEPIVRGACKKRGPVETSNEHRKLLEQGIPKVLSKDGDHHGTCVAPALRWFLGWNTIQGVDLQFIRLWIVLELLARNRSQYVKTRDRSKLALVRALFQECELKEWEKLPLTEMYKARNALVHGDLGKANTEMKKWFGEFVNKRVEKLSPFVRSNLPDPDDYGSCVYEACDMLSRVLEKVFLSLFDCKSTYFFAIAPYFATMEP